MPKTIISDTSCFIVLTNIGELELLQKLYGEVITTTDVAIEYGSPFPGWVQVLNVKDRRYQHILELEIDKGEASAILLAVELGDATVVLDDYKARKVAIRLGLEVTGTLGIIIKAKKKGIILSIKPLLAKLRATDFRLSKELEELALKEVGEE